MSSPQKFPSVAADLVAGGRDALRPLPTPSELGERSPEERHETLEAGRVELYALASLLADAAVQRARRERPAFPPYGLARSMHSQSRLVVANPEPVGAGSIDSFVSLGKAFLDTLVFHLDRRFKEHYQSDERWQLERLEELLALFRVGAGPATRARMKDGFSFLYGGLQFGVSVCVQLTEVMAHLLEEVPGMSAAGKAEVIERSLAPAYRMAALNVAHIVPAYQRLVASDRGGWMDPGKFVVRTADGVPVRVELRDEDLGDGRPRPSTGKPVVDFTTLGCPARTSPSGEASAIATLWRWCGELAHELGLLD